MKNKDAIRFYNWQEKQREKIDLPDFCIKTLDRVKKNAKKLERQVEGSNNYKNTLSKLRADKDKFYRQLKSQPSRLVGITDILPVTSYNISRYTLDMWESAQGGNEENFIEREMPFDLLLYAYSVMQMSLEYNTITEKDLERLKEVQIVTIDEEYTVWLKERGFEDNQENRLRYINTVDKKTADRLLRKNDMDWTYTLCLIPIVVFFPQVAPEKTYWKMTKNGRLKAQEELEKLYGEGNVYIPGVICSLDTILEKENLLIERVHRAMAGNPPCFEEFERQTHDPNSISEEYFAVFAVRYRHKSATIDIDTVFGERHGKEESLLLDPWNVFFEDIDEKEHKFPARFRMSGSVLEKEIANAFSMSNVDTDIYPAWMDFSVLLGNQELL